MAFLLPNVQPSLLAQSKSKKDKANLHQTLSPQKPTSQFPISSTTCSSSSLQTAQAAQVSTPQKGRIWTCRARSNQIQNWNWFNILWEIECQVINFVFINFAISVQFVPWSALKLSFSLPGNPRHTPKVPPDQYHILWRLPHPVHIKCNLSEQDYFDDAKESRVKQIPKIQESSFKNQVSRIKNNEDQDSRLKIQESREDSIKISTKKVFQNIE